VFPDFSLQLFSETSLVLRIIQRDVIKRQICTWSKCKC